MRKKNEKLTNSPMGMWFSSQYVNGGGPINLVAPIQRVRCGRHQQIELRKISWPWVPWEKMMREREKMGELERIRGCKEKKEGREVFVERKERGVMKNIKR